jgi:ribose 5-phosphate isomerase B
MAKHESIIIGSDHAGFKAKEHLVKHLTKKGHVVVDVGTFKPNTPVDYPDYAAKVAKLVAKDKAAKGVLICGSGTGMAMAANRVKGIRASVVYDTYSAAMARKDNDANIITLRGRNFPIAKLPKLVDTFLATPFSGAARHRRRIAKLARL